MFRKIGTFFGRIRTGFGAFFQGFRFIRKNHLWPYWILPSTVSMISGVALFAAVYWVLSTFFLGLSSHVDGTLGEVLAVLGRIAALSVAAVVYVVLYRTIAAIVVLPFMGPLLNQIEKILIGRPIEVSLRTDIANAIKGIWVNVQYAFLGLLVIVITLPLSGFQIFVVAPIQGYLMARGILEYILEKETPSLAERSRRAAAFRPEMLGLGLAYFLVALIPVLGALLGPTAALTGAALVYHAPRPGSALASKNGNTPSLTTRP